MNTDIKNAISAADYKAQYDEKVKRLLGNKMILAHILVKIVDEFYGMAPKDVVPFIEEVPFIGIVPVEPGLTNVEKKEQGQRIVGFNTENAEINEGLIRFDIIFYVRMKDGISQVIVNIEAQKDEPADYDILNRAVFYGSRLISSQKERDFAGTSYNDIKRVYSIWICMNRSENSMNYVHLTDDKLLGSYSWKGRLDLLNIVLIGIADELPRHDDKYELHRLLGTLLARKLSIDDKLGIIETEYNISVDDKMRKDVAVMCNLSQGIWEEGEARGQAIGEARMIIRMNDNGYTLEQIADVAQKSVEEVKAIIENAKFTPV